MFLHTATLCLTLIDVDCVMFIQSSLVYLQVLLAFLTVVMECVVM